MSAFVMAILAKATVVTVVALGCTRLARGSRAAARHLALAAAFAVLLLLPVASLVGPSLRVEIPIAASTGLVVPLSDAVPDVTAIGSSYTVAAGAAALTTRSTLPRVAALVTASWIAGVAAFLLPVIAGVWQMRRVRRTAFPWRDAQTLVDRLARESGIRRRVAVAVSEAITGPVTCGAARPAIVLPPDALTWTDDDCERAIVHELEHVRRGDWLTQSLARIVCAIYWMHPLVWIAWRQLALEAERACDDAVLRRQTIARGADADPTVYADQLVGLAQRLTATKRTPLVAMAARHDLSARVAALLDPRQRRGPARTRWVVLAGGITALLVATISPLRIVAVATEQQPANTASAAHFDAATIKPCEPAEAPPGPARGTMGGTNASFSPGRMNVPCVTLEQLIYLAYAGAGAPLDKQLENVVPGGASDDRKVRGGPSWVHSQHSKFAVEATAAAASDRYVLVGTMLQSLLEDRFHLKVHRGTEDAPMFAMTVAKGGLKIKPMQPGDCAPYDAATFDPDAAKPTCGNLRMGGNGPNVVWRFSGFELRSLAYRLSSALGAFVVDRTGVTDKFMLRLEFHPDESTPGIHWQADGGAAAGAPEAASIFAALEQQVGVRLDKTRGPQGYLVVDHVEPLVGGR